MVCGTPVVAYDRGSMPELDRGRRDRECWSHGIASAVAGVKRAAGFDRAACRQAAERRFSADRMVDDYLDVYEAVLHER